MKSNYFNKKTTQTLIIFLLMSPMSKVFAKAQLAASINQVKFKNILVGARSTQRVIITNIGNKPVESINYTTNCGFDFYNHDSNCIGDDLLPKQSCYLDITYRPYEESQSECLAQIHSNNGHVIILIEGNAIQTN